MIPVQFDYKSPESLAEAVKLLDSDRQALILAGSHSLIADLKQGTISPSLLIDIQKIAHLEGISQEKGVLSIGGMTTYDRVANAPEVKANYPALAEVANSVGDAQIRNWQRIGDFIAYRDLACGFPAVALVLDATFDIVGVEGNHTLKAEAFIKRMTEKQWLPREIVSAIAFPFVVPATGTSYQLIKNPASHYPVCAVAALVELSAEGIIAQCRAAVAGASSYPIRLPEVEEAIKGKAATEENIAAAAKLASESVIANREITIVSDLYASIEYRTHLTNVLTKRALIGAIKRAK